SLAGPGPGRDRRADGTERRCRGGADPSRPARPAPGPGRASRRDESTIMIDDAPTSDPDRLARIERALAEYLLAAGAGTAPDPAAWLAQYPDLQPELGELLAAEAALRRLADPLRPAPDQAMAAEEPTGRSGEHRTDLVGSSAGHSDM